MSACSLGSGTSRSELLEDRSGDFIFYTDSECLHVLPMRRKLTIATGIIRLLVEEGTHIWGRETCLNSCGLGLNHLPVIPKTVETPTGESCDPPTRLSWPNCLVVFRRDV